MNKCKLRNITERVATVSVEDNALSSNNTQSSDEPKVWGDKTLTEVRLKVDTIYDEIVHWRRNVFKLPSGRHGKEFVQEMTRLIDLWKNKSPIFESIALKLLMILSALLLQKPSHKSKSKQHAEYLGKRMIWWKNGEFDKLMDEARAVQSRIKTNTSKSRTTQDIAKRFSNFVLEGKINSALRLLNEQSKGGVLKLDKKTLDELNKKHPQPADVDQSVLLNNHCPIINPIIFDCIDAEAIRKSAIKTKGAAGPSGLDAEGWRRILVSKNFASHSIDLCKSISNMTKRLCIEKITSNQNSNSIEAYTACRLIPLDKSPGVRPIGVGEVLRRIIGKSITSSLHEDIIESAGSLQLCAGQPAGCEAAVTAMRSLFEEDENDAVLLVDATNAFNVLNRNVMLHNIRSICPSIATYVYNCYNLPSRLFIVGGGAILSQEGTTQGDPLAMPIYAVGITPLMALLINENSTKAKHVAYADDIAGTGKIDVIRNWWNNILKNGPKFGFHPKPSKSWLIVKPKSYERALQVFKGTGVNITTKGMIYLGSYLGNNSSKDEVIGEKIQEIKSELLELCQIAKTEPQSAYCAFATGFRNKFMYLIRTTPNITHHLKEFDEILTNNFIPSLTDGRVISTNERKLLSLPVRFGGMGIPIFSDIAEQEYDFSKEVSSDLQSKIINQINEVDLDEVRLTKTKKYKYSRKRNEFYQTILESLRNEMNDEQRRCNDLAQMKCSSSWLTTLPSKDENFVLNKREFFNSISLRYRWQIKYLPSVCVCGTKFDVDHAMSCKKGGFVSYRHNDIRDIIAKSLDEVCTSVQVEPKLIPLTGEHFTNQSNVTNEARLDVSAVGFWNRCERAFFDVRVINPFAQRHRQQNL